MTERELSMKFSVDGSDKLSEPFERMGRAAKDASAEEKAYQQQLKERARYLVEATQTRKQLAKIGQEASAKELSEEQKYQRALRQRIRSYEQAKRMKEDLARAGFGEQHHGMTGMMSKASSFMFSGTGAMAAAEMALAFKIGDVVGQQIVRYLPGSKLSDYNTMAGSDPGLSRTVVAQKKFDLEQMPRDMAIKFADTVGLESIANMGRTHREMDYLMSPQGQAEERIRQAHGAAERSAQRGDIDLSARVRQMGFQREEARYRAMGGYSGEEKAQAQKTLDQEGMRAAGLKQQLANAHKIMAENDVRTSFDVVRQRIVALNPAQQAQRDAYEKARDQARNLHPQIKAAEDAQREQRLILAHRGFGMNSASQQARIQLGGQAALNAAQAQLAGNQGTGYERGQAFRDYESTIGYSMRQQGLLAEQKRQAGIYGFQQMTADQHVGTAQTKVDKARAAVLQAEKDKNRAGDDVQREEKVEQLAQRHYELKLAQAQLEEAIGHSMQMQVQQSEMLNQHSQQRINLTQSEQARLSSIVREEGFKEMGRREHFGLMNPMKQRTYLGIARKMNQGQQLTQKEIEFASGAPELFGKRLQDIALKRTSKGTVYDEMRQLLPELGARGQAAEKALTKIDQQFHVEIKLNETAIIDQLLKKVLPEVHKAMQQANQAAEEARRRMQNQQQAQQRVPFRP